MERILNTSLVPYSLDPSGRMKRLYTLYGNLDEHAVKLVYQFLKFRIYYFFCTFQKMYLYLVP